MIVLNRFIVIGLNNSDSSNRIEIVISNRFIVIGLNNSDNSNRF